MRAASLTAVALVSAATIVVLFMLARRLRTHPKRFEILGLLVAVLGLLVAVAGIVIAHDDTAAGGPKPPGTGAASQASTPSTGIRELQLLSCDQPGGLASHPGTEQTTITFINLSRGTVKLYWINYQGDRIFYSNLSSNFMVDQQTYAGHAWLVADDGDNCKAVFVATEAAAQAIVR